MENSFLKALQELGHFTSSELEKIKAVSKRSVILKKEKLLSEGQVCESIYFIAEGALYQYEIDEDMEEIVIDLHVANDWVLNPKSFTSRQPSKYFIAAYEETIVFELGIETAHQLIAESPTFMQLGKVLGEAMKRLEWLDQQLTPDEKYQYLLTNKPALLQHFPQHMIASFLKITPETLSRVRKRLIS